MHFACKFMCTLFTEVKIKKEMFSSFAYPIYLFFQHCKNKSGLLNFKLYEVKHNFCQIT